ncbi:hypothetical protein [Streptomyces sp. RFCAC02]|uniref:hypothetical protein n=1 Tax=Streptomyces sp. RFCAC02 TaxID=2499143 RepID=UPI00102129B1|nr:hypothetical protein [Streptomyces sp. RFCAC02]
MTRARVTLTFLAASAAAAAALATVPAQAADAGALGACAELVGQAPGSADLRNDCGVPIEASVAVTGQADPACVPIAAYGTAVVRWEGDGTAEYAYDC